LTGVIGRLSDGVKRSQGLLGGGVKHLPERCWPYAEPAAFEQAPPETSLDRQDPLRDRRLRQAQRVSGSAHAAGLERRHERREFRA